MSFIFSLHKNLRPYPSPEDPKKQMAVKAFATICIKEKTNTIL